MLENKEMSEKKKESSKSKRKRIWRGVNTSIVVFSLFAPWLSTCYGEVEVSGGMMVAGSVSAITEVFNDGTLEPLFLSVLSISFVLYLLLNAIRALNPNTLKNNMWLFIPVIGGVGFMLYILNLAVMDDSTTLLWGYWVAGMGMLSSLILESEHYKSMKKESDTAEDTS